MGADNKGKDKERISCAPNLSRKDFMTLVVKRATITGTVLAAPKIIDKFLVPSADAKASSTSASVTA